LAEMPVAADGWVQNTIRIAGAASVAAAGYVISLNPDCGGTHQTGCPSYAFGSSWLLRGERSALSLAILVIVVTFIIRIVVIGTVPDQIGQTSAGWSQEPETIRRVNSNAKELKAAIETVRSEAESRINKAATDAADLIGALEARLAALETSDPVDGGGTIRS
jgi:hypothetical protein